MESDSTLTSESVESPPVTEETPPDSESGWRNSNFQFLGALLFLAVVAVIIILWVMTMMRPGWYTPPSPDDANAAAKAETAEFRFIEELQKIREPGSTWRLRVPDEAINAWLGIRMQKWLAHEDRPPWPEYLGIPQIHTTPSGIIVAVELKSDGGSTRVLGLQFAPTVVDGTMHLEIVGGLLGRLPIPTPPSSLLELVQDEATGGDEASSIAVEYLLEGADFPSWLELVDERTVHIDDVRLEDGSFILVAQTRLRNEHAAAEP